MIDILVTLVVVGVVLYLVESYIPLSAPVKTVIRVVVVLALCIWLLSAFGIVDVPLHLRR